MAEGNAVKSLVGYRVVLDPLRSGMLVDVKNNITLGFFGEGIEYKDSIDVTEEMDQSCFMRNIKTGALRVMKGNEDVTIEFGGFAPGSYWKKTPIVKDIPPISEGSDKFLIAVLSRNKADDVVKDIRELKDFKTLQRLKYLEESGKNLSSSSRQSVLDAIVKQIDSIPGVSPAGEIKEDKKEEIKLF